MSSAGVQCVPPELLLREELRLLDGFINGRKRRRVYRHHHFLRAALSLRASLRRTLPHFAERAGPQRQRAMRKLLASSVRCGEAAAVELSVSRIDTISLAALLLAIASRVGCVAGAFVPHGPTPLRGTCEGKKKVEGLLVTRLPPRQKRPRLCEDVVLPQHQTIGCVFEATIH